MTWRSALIDPFRIVADAVEARRLGAEIVVVSLHWGVEGMTEPSEWQRRVAEGITASDAIDLIVGH
ncbi:MAG TPA: CapA family protein, partial [Ilumatobacteraceae bacterium]|nr:CapA family protein [Ilumatobacteraceae bacterium]